MNWIKNFVRPKIRSLLGQKRDTPENMWIKDPESGEMVFYRDLEANMFVFPGSNHHHRMPAEARINAFFDGGEWEKIALPTVAVDPLKFRDEKKYADRLRDAKAKGQMQDSIHAGIGKVEGLTMVVMVQDMSFIGGSLGMAAGEAIDAPRPG
jgi:acetyl-CoA carboxylase carboxyl transferase subunit beta